MTQRWDSEFREGSWARWDVLWVRLETEERSSGQLE